MRYLVANVSSAPRLDIGWSEAPWRGIAAGQVAHVVGTKKSDHAPKTEFKIAYDAVSVYVMFRVEDRYVRSVATERQGDVFRDSCVEFFFTPGEDLSLGYFNIEMNCGGTMLFHYQDSALSPKVLMSEKECDAVEIAHSMPKKVDPERAEPTTWTVAYAMPLNLLSTYVPVEKPAPGVRWRANFYKCADFTSHPHWLAWAPVECVKPNFHQPKYFGVIEFT